MVRRAKILCCNLKINSSVLKPSSKEGFMSDLKVRPPVATQTLKPNSQEPTADSQPPPKSRPGPSEARKIGLRAATGQAQNICRAAWRAAPQVEEPRLPAVRAMGGNASGG